MERAELLVYRSGRQAAVRSLGSERFSLREEQRRATRGPHRPNRARYWRKEKVTFTAGYGNERMAAYLFLPKNTAAPYQALVYHPGSDAGMLRSSETLGLTLVFFEFAMRSGRAIVFPIYKGTYERQVDGSGPNAERDVSVQAVKDAARSVDYLETRPDIDHARIAFYGLSWGANRGPRICGIESRFKTCVLLAGGFPERPVPPEIDDINFAPRARMPLLELNGRYDFDQSTEKQAKPMFRFWGAPEKDKRMVLYDAGHIPADLREVIREILDWLDKYLGPVNAKTEPRPKGAVAVESTRW